MINVTSESELKLNGLSIIKFYIDNCAPCKRLDTILDKMENEFKVNIYSAKIDDFIVFARKHQIKSAPTLLFLSETKEVNRMVGLVKTETYRDAFKKFLNK